MHLHRRDSATAELAPLFHPLVSEKMEVFINDKEGLVQAIWHKSKFHPLSRCTTSLHNTASKVLSPCFIYISTPHSSLRLPKGKFVVLQKHE